MINAVWSIEFDRSCIKPCAEFNSSYMPALWVKQPSTAMFPAWDEAAWVHISCSGNVHLELSIPQRVLENKGSRAPVLAPLPPFALITPGVLCQQSCCSPLPCPSEGTNFHTLARAPSFCWIFTLLKMHFANIESTTEQCQRDKGREIVS